ncbi:MAG TPA: hypothetical protein VK533_00420 [Sphingomonas sp.]|uniref:oxidoreductase n=1 Tax=Sphingomonas sp. TaxID=28214 RepID=UPI002C989CB9|nr:hypothetical protein [Sphingomonas sp.]HMI17981.1 hypothetical protein [Sphingomonas sp.]
MRPDASRADEDCVDLTAGLAGLSAPLQIAGATLRNRFVVPSMQRGITSDHGAPPPELADYYGRFADGGFALVMSESCAIDHPSASAKTTCVRLNRQTETAWRRCVDSVRRAGAHMFIQLWHEGGLRLAPDAGDRHADDLTLSPSGLAGPGEPAGREMTVADFEDVKAGYVDAARRAQEIGASGIELHAGHGFLLDQFLWSETNQRPDRYGGSMANRVRFPSEIVQAIREATDREFAISLRFSQWKGNHGRKPARDQDAPSRIADTPDELGIMLSALRQAGVDVFHASTRTFDKPEWEDNALSLAAWTRKLGDAPVIGVGSVGTGLDVIKTLYEGLDIDASRKQRVMRESLSRLARQFAEGAFDLIAVGRSSIGDQQWVNKIATGRFDEITMFDRAMLQSIVSGIR